MNEPLYIVPPAAPVQEPVAWMCSDKVLIQKGYKKFADTPDSVWNIPVYTTPPAQPAPVQEPVAWSPNLDYPGYEDQRVWANGKPGQQDIDYWSKNGNGITIAVVQSKRKVN